MGGDFSRSDSEDATSVDVLKVTDPLSVLIRRIFSPLPRRACNACEPGEESEGKSELMAPDAVSTDTSVFAWARSARTSPEADLSEADCVIPFNEMAPAFVVISTRAV